MVVSNTTPLIAFARIGELDLLQKIVGHILIFSNVCRSKGFVIAVGSSKDF